MTNESRNEGRISRKFNKRYEIKSRKEWKEDEGFGFQGRKQEHKK